MAEIKEYDIVFRQDPGCWTPRRVKAYDAADALVQADLMIRNDSRIDILGQLHGHYVASIAPVEPAK